MKFDIFGGEPTQGLYQTKKTKTTFIIALIFSILLVYNMLYFFVLPFWYIKKHKNAIIILVINIIELLLDLYISVPVPNVYAAIAVRGSFTFIFSIINLILFYQIVKLSDETSGYSAMRAKTQYLEDKKLFKNIIQASKDCDATKLSELLTELDAKCKEKVEKEFTERENNKTPYEPEYDGKSYFDATISSFVGLKVLCWILNVVGLFFFTKPLIICMKERWAKRYSVIEGRRLGFDGTAMELFGSWIIWGFFTLITLGIFAFFKPIRLEKWKAKHTSIAGGAKNVNSKFDGWLAQYLGWRFLSKIITFATLGIAYPFAICMMMKWYTKHCVYNGYRMKFDGNGFQIFGKWVWWLFLSFITFGIFGFFVALKMQQWKTKHTHIKQSKEEIFDF